MTDDNRRLVYSTDQGWSGEALKRAKKPQQAQPNRVPDDGILRVARESRRGGVMSIVTGLNENELVAVSKTLKKLCGTGGTAKNGVLEIQGDHRDKIVAYFEQQNRRIKKAGG